MYIITFEHFIQHQKHSPSQPSSFGTPRQWDQNIFHSAVPLPHHTHQCPCSLTTRQPTPSTHPMWASFYSCNDTDAVLGEQWRPQLVIRTVLNYRLTVIREEAMTPAQLTTPVPTSLHDDSSLPALIKVKLIHKHSVRQLFDFVIEEYRSNF